MAYTPTEWKNRVYDEKTGEVLQEGTPISAKNMNNIEQGIVNLEKDTATQLAQTAQQLHDANLRIGALEGIAESAKIYGVYWDKSSNPTLTRTGDAVGMVANAGVDGQLVQNDFDKAQIYREIEEVTDDYGNVFMKIPKFYIKKTDGENFKTWEISRMKFSGSYLPWCFWDFENYRELPYILIGKYKGTVTNNRLESKPDLLPTVSQHIVNCRNFARNNNANGLTGYQLLDIHVVDVLQTLFYVEFGTLHSQSVMAGFTAGRYTATDLAIFSEENTNRIIVTNAVAAYYRVGQTISVGTNQGGNQIFYGRTIINIENFDDTNSAIYFDGNPVTITAGNMLYNTGWRNGFSKNILASSGSIASNMDGKYPHTYRGIESFWGDVWQWVDGININGHQSWITKNAEDYISNVFATPYEQLSYINSTSSGYVKGMGYDGNQPFASIPTTVGGSSTTYYADNYYQNTEQRAARLGGCWNTITVAGISSWGLEIAASNANILMGARLVKKAL